MKKSLLPFLSIIILLILSLSACSQNNLDNAADNPMLIEETDAHEPVADELTFDDVEPEDDANVNKKIYQVELPEMLRDIIKENYDLTYPSPVADYKDVMAQFQTPDLSAEIDSDIAERIINSKQDDRSTPSYLTHEEILLELDYIFDVLKYGYAGYQYFGGDDVFLTSKKLMQEKLNLMSDPISENSYEVELLGPIIKAIINDNHFSIGWQSPGSRSRMYLNDELFLQKTEDGYTMEMEGRTYKVIRAGYELECIYPTLSKEGELAWTFGWLETDGRERMEQAGVGVTLKDIETAEEVDHIFQLYPISYEYRHTLSEALYTVSEVSGITVLDNRRLQQFSGDLSLSEFTRSGSLLKNESVLILDLRCHAGGNDAYAKDWITLYTGQSPSYSMFIDTSLLSKTARAASRFANNAATPKWSAFSYAPPKLIANDNLLIVLMDDAIGSSGESFIGYLRQLENVVFIGTNTYGCLVTGDYGQVILPISRKTLTFCTGLNLRPDLSQFEGIGFMPDLWVQPGESLERVLKFVERYNDPSAGK